jgi:Holliday junction resolvase-like predicted endonuclease
MATTEKRKTGDLGEDIAERFLMKQGYRIVERNYLRKWGEIDIIAKKDGKLYFVEVKTVTISASSDCESNTGLRKPTVFGLSLVPHETAQNKFRDLFCDIFLTGARGFAVKEVTHETKSNHHTDSFRPEDNLHAYKLQRLRRTIQAYLAEKGIGEESDWQFDAMCVYLDGKGKYAEVECLKDIIL